MNDAPRDRSFVREFRNTTPYRGFKLMPARKGKRGHWRAWAYRSEPFKRITGAVSCSEGDAIVSVKALVDSFLSGEAI